MAFAIRHIRTTALRTCGFGRKERDERVFGETYSIVNAEELSIIDLHIVGGLNEEVGGARKG